MLHGSKSSATGFYRRPSGFSPCPAAATRRTASKSCFQGLYEPTGIVDGHRRERAERDPGAGRGEALRRAGNAGPVGCSAGRMELRTLVWPIGAAALALV